MAHGFILLAGGKVALVVLRTAFAGIEKELGQRDVRVTATMAFLIVDEAAKANQGLLHLLVAVVPALLAGSDVGHPAVGQSFGGVVEAKILAVGQRVVVDGRLDEIAGDIAFMVAAVIGGPAFRPVF